MSQLHFKLFDRMVCTGVDSRSSLVHATTNVQAVTCADCLVEIGKIRSGIMRRAKEVVRRTSAPLSSTYIFINGSVHYLDEVQLSEGAFVLFEGEQCGDCGSDIEEVGVIEGDCIRCRACRVLYPLKRRGQ